MLVLAKSRELTRCAVLGIYRSCTWPHARTITIHQQPAMQCPSVLVRAHNATVLYAVHDLPSPVSLFSLLTFRYCTAPPLRTSTRRQDAGPGYNLVACTSSCVPAPAFPSLTRRGESHRSQIAVCQSSRSRTTAAEAMRQAIMMDEVGHEPYVQEFLIIHTRLVKKRIPTRSITVTSQL